MINKFRHKMKAPIIGIGHSMGCAKLVYLASIHPKLFHSLILIDPVLQDFHPPGPNAALFSSMRREHWTSRAKAESQISSNAFFSSMDPRALKLFLEFALRDTPNGGVTLSTPKAQEAWTYVRSNLLPLSENTLEGRHRERVLNPELVPFSEESRLKSMRPELLAICSAMPHLRPRTLYVYGEYSHINHDEVRTYHIEITGTGRGGNGGVAEGGVKDVDIVDCGHLCVLEKPGVIAEYVSNWLGDEVARWKEEISIWEKVDTGRSKNSQTELSDAWMAAVKEDTMAERPKAAEKAKL
jgi:pimeloyl-ACP methyl ester carboxylesterase